MNFHRDHPTWSTGLNSHSESQNPTVPELGGKSTNVKRFELLRTIRSAL
eukprot:COSAG02_NODE_5729_length_4088_cov_1.319629_4_plen_49_part_00